MSNPPASQTFYQPQAIKKRKSTSLFAKFYVVEDGLISLSLRDLTLIGCLSTSIAILYMLYNACKYDMVECTYPVLPMISDCICLPMYDRIFCMCTTFFTLCAYQADVRAFYNKLYGIATDRENDSLLVLGIVTTFSLPAIGYFDEHTYSTIHGTMAGLFFISVCLYGYMIAGIMDRNRNIFPESE